MNQSIQIFSNPLGDIRAMMHNDEPYFIASDVASALGYALPRKAISDHCEIEDVLKWNTPTKGGSQLMSYINESGMYALILGSKLPQAKKFKSWVTKEVLPTIRKHGMYAKDELLDNPDLLIQVATSLKEEREARRLAESKAAMLEQVTLEQAPKVLFANAVETAKQSCLIGELAKILKQNGVDIGQNRLFKWLRENGYLCKQGESYNQPTQKGMDLGLFELKKRTINNPDGSVLVTSTTKCTGKGQIYFTNKFLSQVQWKQ